ncbi:alpha-amylase family glycosyl hydrolase [Fusibacter tunisiensis]|uniref:Alpha-amylase n=1 Tax=Fusibacter tunisiensis TaxID=1008308 RepID=A0ABS2MT04_9FIRM|nr:alpha-amylase family glycosyl hydrolase [Fusibacter tunisiensis]MBM7562537.1 alpha-amylase [Fusibacter tunisiensis]
MKRITIALISILILLSGCTQTTPAEKGITEDDRIYFILVDRFMDASPNSLSDVNPHDPKAFQGGDLEGIVQRLDYIKSLGMTAIWITPIMQNGPGGYHGYWIHDFYAVDPHFGDLETFKRLVTEAHKRDIKVILDYIVNHTGYDAPWLTDSEKKDWFNPNRTIENWRDPEDVELGWLAGLPDLDQTNPEVAQYFIDNALWWIDETGIDGFRLDTVRHVPKSYWVQFTNAIKAEYPDFFFLGEVWDENTRNLEAYRRSGMDSVTNYSLYAGLQNAFNPLPNMFSLVNAFSKEETFESAASNALFIDNHDNPRYVSLFPKNGEAHMKQALTFMYTYPNIPVLYYGTEIAMTGGADPDNRKFMDWEATESHEFPDYIRLLTEIRKTYVDTFSVIDFEKDHILYEIQKEGQRMLVLINASSKPKTISFDHEASRLLNYTSKVSHPDFSDGHFESQLEAFEILFLVVE